MGRVLWPLLTPCLRAFARHPFRPWQGLTEYEYASFLPRRLHLPHGLLMMYRISACFAASSVHLALYAVPVRAVGISPRTSFPTGRCRTAAVLQVCVSASSRHLVDFHHSSRIASVVQSSRGAFAPLSHHRTCQLRHTAVSGTEPRGFPRSVRFHSSPLTLVAPAWAEYREFHPQPRPCGLSHPRESLPVTPCNRDLCHGLPLIRPFPPGLFGLAVLWPLLTPCRRTAPQPFRALAGSHRI